MIDPESYIDKGLKAVDQILDRGDLVTALKACEELLRVNPYHRGVQEYIRNIHAHIIKENEAKVDKDIEATMSLWNEKKYDQLRTIYGKLIAYAPEHKKLRSLIIKLNETVTDDAKKEQNEVKAQAIKAIEELMAGQKLDEAIAATDELKEYFPLDAEVEKISHKARYAKIDQQLEANPQFQNNADFMAVEGFYESLLKIDPTHEQVKKLLLNTREHDTKSRILDSKIHLNESIERMKQLFANSEYEKVLQACEEILQQDASNLTAKFYRRKAISTVARESDVLELRQLKEQYKTLSSEYAADKSKFVKV